MTYRMQIVVDDKARENLLWLADDRNVSVSRIIRDLASEKARLMKKARKRNANTATILLESVKRIKKLGGGGPPDLSTNDEYIYG